MRAALRLIPCLGLAALVIWGHEQGAQTWTPMFRLILALPAAWLIGMPMALIGRKFQT